MTTQEGAAAIEAILFAMGDSVETGVLEKALGVTAIELRTQLEYLKDKYSREDSGIGLVELENAVQLCTKKEQYEVLIRIAKTPKKVSLTDTLLETLSIIAYKQPITRLEVERIRGVNSDHAVNRLVELGFVCEIGRLDAPGKPLLFGTTEQFLRSFGVRSLDDLPQIDSVQIEEFKVEAEQEISVKMDV
ncbi:MAG: SMC-Scp complex subunit ScpB [Lachnospiraceae bacterium]|nr:SMC-Scp complex subunit ScpB [Lachnospiraceae bacterium]